MKNMLYQCKLLILLTLNNFDIYKQMNYKNKKVCTYVNLIRKPQRANSIYQSSTRGIENCWEALPPGFGNYTDIMIR